MQILILKLKRFAELNYDNGMDGFVECYDDKDWVELIKNVGSTDLGMLQDFMIELADCD